MYPPATDLSPSAPLSKLHSSSIKSPILLCVGSPGTGETSVSQSTARSLLSPISTYLSWLVSMTKPKCVVIDVLILTQVLELSFKHSVKPRVLILSLFLTKSTKLDNVIPMKNPRVALLEVLDPKQCNDHYINVPTNLSLCCYLIDVK